MKDRYRNDRGSRGFDRGDDGYRASYGRGFDGDRQSRGFDDRGGRGGFDSGPSVEMDVTVKWYNPAKGFGFVELSDGSGDAFIGARAIEAAGHGSLEPGSRLRVTIQSGARGRQVGEIVKTLEIAAPVQRQGNRPDFGQGRGPRQDDNFSGETYSATGTVKWFNPEKGFGFVTPNGGGKDVFLHITALRRSGLDHVDEGSPVEIEIGNGRKGQEVLRVTLL